MSLLDWYLAPLLGYAVLLGETQRLLRKEKNPAKLATLNRKTARFRFLMAVASVGASFALWEWTK